MSPKSRTCSPKRNNFRDKAIMSFSKMDRAPYVHDPIVFHTTVSARYWDSSYRATAARRRRAANRVNQAD